MAVANAGELIAKIKISFPSTVINEEGGQELLYGGFVETFARVRRLSGNRGTEAGSNYQLQQKEFIIRWGSYGLMDQNILIEYEGKPYIVDQINLLDEGQQRFFQIIARVKDYPNG